MAASQDGNTGGERGHRGQRAPVTCPEARVRAGDCGGSHSSLCLLLAARGGRREALAGARGVLPLALGGGDGGFRWRLARWGSAKWRRRVRPARNARWRWEEAGGALILRRELSAAKNGRGGFLL